MDRRGRALKILYDMAEQTLDRGSYSYEEWPEAWEALDVLLPEVYPDGGDFVKSEIQFAEETGIRNPQCLEEG